MANQRESDGHLLHLRTTKQFKCTQELLSYLYLEHTLIHPIQIRNIEFKRIMDQNKQYLIITLQFRSVSERNVFVFKILEYKGKDLNIHHDQHKDNFVHEIRKHTHIINFASNARQSGCVDRMGPRFMHTTTYPPCVIRRFKGIGVINIPSDSPYVIIEVCIEPYYDLKMNSNEPIIPLLHTLPPPYVVALYLCRKDIATITPTVNNEIRGYQINLRRIPIVNKLKSIEPKPESQISIHFASKKHRKCHPPPSELKAICRWNDQFCPKQHHKPSPCPYEHKAWLEPAIDHGNNTDKWQSRHVMSWEPAASPWSTHQEFDMHSSDLVDVLKYSSIIRLEFITMDPRDYQLLDCRLNKLMKHKIIDEVDLCRIPTAYPNHIPLKPKCHEYDSPYIYGKRTKNNIDSIKAFMKKWNENGHHNISFALKACITNWPLILVPEDIDHSLLIQIDQDMDVSTLIIMAQNEAFREKYAQQLNITASEIYLNAKDWNDSQQEMDHKKGDMENEYALRWIKILPFHMELAIHYIAPNLIFANTEEGNAYAKLTFVSQTHDMEHRGAQYPKYHYKPIQFAEHSDTLIQIREVLRGGIIIGNTSYQLMWFGDTDCKHATVTMISPPLLPSSYTLSGLRIKYSLNTMLNQESRMKHVTALETTATKMAHRIQFDCITGIANNNHLFDGCGIINTQWLKAIMEHNQLFGYKRAYEDKYPPFGLTRAELGKQPKKDLEDYLKQKGRAVRHGTDKDALVDMMYGLWKHEQDILKGDALFDDPYDADHEKDPIAIQPIEAQIGDIRCILVPYPQKVMDEIIATHGTKYTNKSAYIYLPENMYQELCVFEYQRYYKGSGHVLFIDDDSDEDVRNAEEADPEFESEKEDEPTEDALIAMMKARGIPSYLVNEVIKTTQYMKEQNVSQLNDDHCDDPENVFISGDIPEYAYHKLVSSVRSNARVPFYIYQDTKRCELLTTSKELINILEYHRQQQDQEVKSDDDHPSNTSQVLKDRLVQMVKDNEDMMDSNNLQHTEEAMRFLEIHNEKELYDAMKSKYWKPQQEEYSHLAMHARNTIPKDSVEFKRLMEIRDEIWKSAIDGEIPFITEPFVSRRMMAICDHTGIIPDGAVFIQLKTPMTAPKPCLNCGVTIPPFEGKCPNCLHFKDEFRCLHYQKVIIMESGALSPLSLQVFDAIKIDKLEKKLFPNQNILIFSSKDRNLVSSLSATSNYEEDTSYLNVNGRCKLFDCIIVPQVYYKYGHEEHYHIPLERSPDFRNQQDRKEAAAYLKDFHTAFFPSNVSSIQRAGFDVPLCLQAPMMMKEESDNEMKYPEEEDEKENAHNAIWDQKTSYVWDTNQAITTMDQYIEYFEKFNQANFAEDWKERFEIECQLKTDGMGSPLCRDFMKLFAHYTHLAEYNYSVNVCIKNMYKMDHYPHYMLDKPIMMGKHVATLCGEIFDRVLKALPPHLHHLVDASLIQDPQRDYTKSVMNPQQIKWLKENEEKKKNDKRCRHCNLVFPHWRERKKHVEGNAHKLKMEELRANKGADRVQSYIDEVGTVKHTPMPMPMSNGNDNHPSLNNDAAASNSIQMESNNYNDNNNNTNEDDWIFDVVENLRLFTEKVAKKLSEQRDGFLRAPSHLKYQQFKTWRGRLKEFKQLVIPYEDKLGNECFEQLNKWERYLTKMELIYREEVKKLKQQTNK